MSTLVFEEMHKCPLPECVVLMIMYNHSNQHITQDLIAI